MNIMPWYITNDVVGGLSVKPETYVTGVGYVF